MCTLLLKRIFPDIVGTKTRQNLICLRNELSVAGVNLKIHAFSGMVTHTHNDVCQNSVFVLKNIILKRCACIFAIEC